MKISDLFMKSRFENTRTGFTLAEVLITLGIIGVVAAMTMPTLIQNYKKKTYVEGLKVAFSTIQQGVRKAMADDGVDNFIDTTLYMSCSSYGPKVSAECKSAVSKYFKVVDTPVTFEKAQTIENVGKVPGLVTILPKDLNADRRGVLDIFRGSNIFTLSNGMFVGYNNRGNKDIAADVAIDINGLKGPNQYGRDAFFFRIWSSGELVARYSYRDLALTAKCIGQKEPTFEEVHTEQLKECSPKSSIGYGETCAARVIDEGWQMNY